LIISWLQHLWDQAPEQLLLIVRFRKILRILFGKIYYELRPPPSKPGRSITLQAQPVLEIGRLLQRNVTDSLFTAQTWEPVLAMKPLRYRSIWARASLNVCISKSYLLVKKKLKVH